ncbi:hypothetical protein SAMN04488115_103447 [Bosea lathyri]|uniref:Uncharacterized protein n=1 Tax=Bosea lathyri TaxID=1036778 RepID=A0A1H5XYM9_9HYPH|nr:hypothetical protein SAMN04488115_103447 [Bosea lathyri]
MTKQFAIAAGNHGVGTPEKAHDSVPCRGSLPFIAGKLSGAENRFCDILLSRPVARAISGPQHAPGACQLLARQTRVRRHDAAVEGCQKSGNRFQAVEAVEPERDQRSELFTTGDIGRPDDMNALAIAEVMQVMRAILRDQSIRYCQRFGNVAIGREEGRRRRKDDRAGIGLWKPEDFRLGGVQRGICGEIANPTAGWRARSTPSWGASPG